MVHFLVTFVLASLCAVHVHGLRCLSSCQYPGYCTRISQCGANEMCGIEKNEISTFEILEFYSYGCRSTKTCSSYKNVTTSRQTKVSHDDGTDRWVSCQECCDSDICNSAGCGSDYQRAGPVCYNCENVFDPEQCTRIQFCKENEVCYIKEIVKYGVRRYTSGCQRKQKICSVNGSGDPQVIGRKRRNLRTRRSSLLCLNCCSTDLCNERCGTHQKTTGVSGQKFLLGFLRNYKGNSGIYMECLITSGITGAFEVKVPYLNIDERRTLHVGENIVNLTYTIRAKSFVVENKGIYIETTNNVNIHAMYFRDGSSDGFTVIPIDQLSTEYVIVTEEPYIPDYTGFDVPVYNSEVLVIAKENNTSIRFKFNTNGTILYNQQTYDNNRDLTISLNQYETFQIEHKHDLTGTIISSSSPVAVISGNLVGCLAFTCSHLSEMIPPINALGKKYIIPLFQVSNSTTHYIRVICTQDSTRINYTVNGQTHSTNLNKAQRVDKLFMNGEFMYLTSSKPVLVSVSVRYSDSPFMTIVPAVDQYLSNYTFAVPSAGFTSYGNIIIDASFTSGLYLDGKLLNVSCPMVKTAFSNAQYCLMDMPLTPGYHTLHHNTRETFALFIFGLRDRDGYGFLAGMNFGP